MLFLLVHSKKDLIFRYHENISKIACMIEKNLNFGICDNFDLKL